ncbi:M24 family metallopeptidase [Labrys sp. La1]|uniref:M24 family metallopeptidase n=1 Tax=Labrys sp. La1 TaxID=3404917 RepID=UPI003EC06859
MLLNQPRLCSRMAELALDAIIATSPENVTYLSNFWALPQWIRRGPQAYVVWPRADLAKPAIITGTSTLDLVADQAPQVEDVRRYGEFHIEMDSDAASNPVDKRHLALREELSYSDALTALIETLKDKGLQTGRIAIDETGLEQGYLEQLKEALPTVIWVPGAGVLRHVRAIKTPVEIERLRQIAQISERSIAAALSVVREGASEHELARAFHVQTVVEGAMPVLGCIGFGERSALPNVQPSERQLREGEIIRFDVGGRFGHYRADIARNAVLGEAPLEARRLHHALLRGVEHACQIIRPGVYANQVFKAVMDVVRREGIPHYKRDHVGHGIGLDGYDLPLLSGSSDQVLEEGMVLCVETPYYEVGRWGLQVEDMIVVRSDGVERLMATDGSLIEVTP